MELSKHLKEYSRTIPGKTQTVINAFAKALEVIPRQLSENSGFDPTEVLNRLRQKHSTDPINGKFFGVNVNDLGVCNTFENAVWEPSMNKINSIIASSEAACLILCIDETVRNPKSEQPGAVDANGVGLGRGGPGKKTLQADKLLKGRGRGIKTLQGRGGK
jgi:T-complex protein 1 subunit eta